MPTIGLSDKLTDCVYGKKQRFLCNYKGDHRERWEDFGTITIHASIKAISNATDKLISVSLLKWWFLFYFDLLIGRIRQIIPLQ